VQLFLAPASQFQNEFLRDERGFSAAMITVFTLATSTPAGLGIVVGGRLADVRGRRIVGAVGLVGGAAATAGLYLSAGWGLWAWSVSGSVVAAMTVPALGVYGPELFPTGRRGRSNGMVSVLSVAGSSVGLLLVGALSGPIGSIGTAVAVLAPAPVLVAALVLLAYPETAHVELEDLNPQDRPAPAD
jgi:MFS family permease